MVTFLSVALLGVLLRWIVSLYPYSGADKPPMYGDYEAQRHWQEITVNLPLKDWYANTTSNDLQYWGLDYPPLTAYHSYLCGLVAKEINPDFVELYKSRGFESPEHKLFMRYSVLFIDLVLYIPACYLFAKAKIKRIGVSQKGMLCFIALVLYPGICLVDYGHFQYNNASFGLFIAAVAALLYEQDCVASVLFCLALNYKQMELYHALPFFFYLLGTCFKQGSSANVIKKLVKLSLTVLITFSIVWAPFLSETQVALQVLGRLFPLDRGLYEDKVANLWCSLSVIVKLKTLVKNHNMALICLAATGLCMLPSSINLLMSPNLQAFKYALVNSAFVFFLMSYHVHEKSILLVTIPACMLFDEEPFIVTWLFMVSNISMLPLFIKDGLVVPALCLTVFSYVIYRLTMEAKQKNTATQKVASWLWLQPALLWLSLLGLAILTVASLTLMPPPTLPDIFPLLISVYCCIHYCIFTIYFHYRQFTLKVVHRGTAKKKMY